MFDKHLFRIYYDLEYIIFADAVELNVDDTDLNQYIQNAVASFKLKIHQAAQRHEYGVRRRRSLDDLLNVNVTGMYTRFVYDVIEVLCGVDNEAL